MDEEVKIEIVESGFYEPDLDERIAFAKETYQVWHNMIEYGGAFVKRLGAALIFADEDNTRRIKEAFPEYWAKYRDMGDAHDQGDS